MLVAEYSYETDIEVQRKEAWSSGKLEGKLETARNCLSMGFTKEQAIKISGITLSEVEKL